jgi:heptosyltransferase-2
MQPIAVSNPPRRILVRGVNWLGDAVMTTPAMMRLRERFPGTHITLLTPEKLEGLWLHHAAVDEIITLKAGEGPLSTGRRLRAGDFDLALVFPNSPRSAIEAWLARIPRRIGYARPWRNWFLTGPIPTRPGHTRMRKRSVNEIRRLAAGDTHEPATSPGRVPADATMTSSDQGSHQIHEYLHLAAALGANPEPVPPRLFITPDELEAARNKFGIAGITNPVFGLNPGAEFGPAKRWPVERFIAAAQEIHKRTHCVWLILGGKGDAEVAGRIESDFRPRASGLKNLAGRTSLRELCALLKICRVMLTNDTGPMHAAAALGTPVVAAFGSTDPRLTGPGLPGDSRHRLLESDAPCSPCFLRKCPIDFRCMNGIGVGRVVEAVLEILHP